MCANVKCVTVWDDKQSIHVGFPKHFTVTGWTGWMIFWERIITKRLKYEPYPKHCGRVTRPSGKKSNKWSLQHEKHDSALKGLAHSILNSYDISTAWEVCPFKVIHSLQDLQWQTCEELKLWGSNLPEETPQAFTHSTLMWKVSLKRDSSSKNV